MTHRLTFYDAAYWAVARERNIALVTADAELLKAGAGVTPTDFIATHKPARKTTRARVARLHDGD